MVAGLLSLGLPLTTASTRYVDDGTTFAFLLVLLSYASYLPAEVERRASAAAGAAALGFALFHPTLLGFDRLGEVGAGAWLAVCAGLIPVGGLLAWEGSPSPVRRETGPAGLPLLLAAAGLALVLAGLWLPAHAGGATFWDLSSSGHALGILLLVAAALAAGLVLVATLSPAPVLCHGALLAAAATFGVSEAPLVAAAFADLGSLGSGAWVEAAGGALLVSAAAVVALPLRPGSLAAQAASAASE